jgi:8-oxo-dGTP pyrophosphatase MutT (NUDIX family)
MVSRQFSLGLIEFIRGKYDVSDAKTIINLFEQMYDHEIKYVGKNQYDDILYYFLNRNNESKEVVLNRIYEGKYSHEYCEAKIKFNMLLNPSDDENSDIPLDLYFYTKYIKPRWDKPEWGFPKGRRDKRTEENLSCACREFEEETGYKNNEYDVLNKIEPIEEKMVGTNGVSYKHIYYLAINSCDRNTQQRAYDVYEIGDIKWFTYDEAMSHIRPYHIEKKKILTRIYLFILNYLIHNNCNITNN